MALDEVRPMVGDLAEGALALRADQALVIEGLNRGPTTLVPVDVRLHELQASDRAVGERPALPFAAERLDHEGADDLGVAAGDIEHVGERPLRLRRPGFRRG